MRTLALASGFLFLSACGGPSGADGGTGGGGFFNTGGGTFAGGGSATGGGTSTGGGSATGGGTATGGGSATGGGTSTGGGAATGGGSATGGGTTTGGGAATGGGGATGGGAATGGGTATGGGGGSGEPDAGCTFIPSPADGPRRVVVSHPFPPDGGNSDNQWEVLNLSATGVLTTTGTFFRMGRSYDGTSPIVFTPDGRIGLVAQNDGTIGVFRFAANGSVQVVHAGYTGSFSAGKLVMHPNGNQVWITDFNTLNNNGGIYSLDIACDGTLSNERYLLSGNNAAAAVVVPNTTELLVAGRSLGTSAMLQDIHVASFSGPLHVLNSTTAFPDNDAIASTLTISSDNRIVALPDNGYFAGARVAFLERIGSGLTVRQSLATGGPYSVTFSPFNDLGMLVNGDGADHYRRVTWNAAATNFTISGPLTYAFGRPQLPSAPVMITRGALTGRMLIAELDSVRQLQFQPDGGITDVSNVPAGGVSSGQTLGTIGVTP